MPTKRSLQSCSAKRSSETAPAVAAHAESQGDPGEARPATPRVGAISSAEATGAAKLGARKEAAALKPPRRNGELAALTPLVRGEADGQFLVLGGEFQQLGAERAVWLVIGHHRGMRGARAVRHRALSGCGLRK